MLDGKISGGATAQISRALKEMIITSSLPNRNAVRIYPKADVDAVMARHL